MRIPFRQLVAEALKRRGTATITELLGDVGHFVSAGRAVAEGRRVKEADRRRGKGGGTGKQTGLESRGRRSLIYDAAKGLLRTGQAERVARGVYRWAESLPFRPVERRA